MQPPEATRVANTAVPPAPPPPTTPPPPQRPRSRLGRLVWSVALIAVGLLAVVDLAGADLPASVYPLGLVGALRSDGKRPSSGTP